MVMVFLSSSCVFNGFFLTSPSVMVMVMVIFYCPVFFIAVMVMLFVIS